MTAAPPDRDPRVDRYIDALPDWQQAICNQVRELVHAADREVQETIKRRVQPYFVLQGNICALLATKDHVNVFLYDGGIVPDPEATPPRSSVGCQMRHMRDFHGPHCRARRNRCLAGPGRGRIERKGP
jgi:hypothetical protein